MGNNESNNTLSQLQALHTFQRSYLTPIRQVQNSTLVKCVNLVNDKQIVTRETQDSQPSFYLEKIFVSDSQAEYNFLTKYLQKQSLLKFQASSEITKISKIYQEVQKGFCSNNFLIRVLFEYSDITLRDQVKIRNLKRKKQHSILASYFQYQDLCNIMFACISSILAAQKMRQNLKQFIQQNQILLQNGLNHLDTFITQFKYNIPMNLDRIIIMPDGTIKVINPLVLDHQDRMHHSHKFIYSPEKIKDFLFQDGIKGRIFEVGLVVLQCALLQKNQQMQTIYQGYSLNTQKLQNKIKKAAEIYHQLENYLEPQVKLFELIQKMTLSSPTKRINLQECIIEAESLFQINKKMRQSIQIIQNQKVRNAQNQRMSVEQLQIIPPTKISRKICSVQNKLNNQKTTAGKYNFQEKTTARVTKSTLIDQYTNADQIYVSNFNIEIQNVKMIEETRQNTLREAQQSLMIKNHCQQSNLKDNQKGLQSLIGKNSNLYDTKTFNFLQSKYEYGGTYGNNCGNIKFEQGFQLNQKSEKASPYKQFMYKKLLNKSISSKRNSQNIIEKDLKKQKFLRQRKNFKVINQNITTSKFMDIENMYKKYDFIEKTQNSNSSSENNRKTSFFQAINYDQNSYGLKTQNKKLFFSGQNSQNSQNFSTNKKSEVLEKITPESILKGDQKQNSSFLINY